MCTEPSKVMTIHAVHFQAFLEVIPSFRDVFQTATKSMDTFNQLAGFTKHRRSSFDGKMNNLEISTFEIAKPSDATSDSPNKSPAKEKAETFQQVVRRRMSVVG